MKNYIFFLTIAFLNAFVDIGHKITLQNVVFTEYSGTEQVILIAIINAMILLPFILLLTPAGFISDKYPKNRIIKYGALAAVGITALISVSYYFDLFWLAFGLTFLIATQSAIYGPAKLGYIRDLVTKDKISKLNGLLQSVAIIGILASMAFFSFLFEGQYKSETGLNSLFFVSLFFVFFSIVEYFLSLYLPEKTELREGHFKIKEWVNLSYIKKNLSTFKNPVINQSMFGLAIFWLIIQVVAVVFPAYAKSIGVDSVLVINGILASTGIGIFFGSLWFAKLSKNFIEVGTIPIGAIGVAASVYLISITTDQTMFFIAFFGAGFFGGIFIVPLNSLIQFHSEEDKLGITMATSNWLQSIFMLGGLVVTTIIAYIGYGSNLIIVIVSLLAIVSALYTVYKIPQSLVHFLISMVFKRKYKLQVDGINNIPSTGPVLLLGNHVSWIDWALLQMACPRRIRFLMDRGIYEKWYLKKFLDFFGVGPIAGGGKDSLKLILKYLDEGELVCIFPEGVITRNGQMSEFKKGFEKVLELSKEKVSVIPFYIRGLWGDTFSRADLNFKGNIDSNEITIIFGEKVEEANTENVKQAVTVLSTAAWDIYYKSLKPIHLEILSRSLKHGKRMLVSDTTGMQLSGYKFLTAAIMFRNKLNLTGENIGLLLPASGAGMIVHTALLMKGKTIVNLNYTSGLPSIEAAVKMTNIETIVTSKKFIEKLKTKGFDMTSILEGKNVLYMEDEKAKMSKVKGLCTYIRVQILPELILKQLYFKKVETDKTAVILFSSGSEGMPKGVELSHRNIVGNVKQIVNIINPTKEDSILGILPLFHAFGVTVSTFLPLIEGIPVVAHPDPTDVRTLAKVIAKNKITIMAGTSTLLKVYAGNKRIHPLMLNSLRYVIAGAERLDQNVRKSFKEKFGKDILEGYGATETSPVAAVNITDVISPADFSVQIGSKPGTVGLPIPGTTIKIIDPEELSRYVTGTKLREVQKEKTGISNKALKAPFLKAGEAGMILISGPQLMKGYLNNQSKTNEVIVEIEGAKWYVSGDKGSLDSDGFLTIIDRYSRFIKILGEQVSLTAIEIELGKFIPEVDFIAVAAPCEKKGEKLVLIHEPIEDISALRSEIQKKIVNKNMIPAVYLEVEEVPKLGTGKKDFKEAKNIYMKSLVETN